MPIVAGEAAAWEVGEEHQTWATTPMVAVIVETTGSFDLNHHVVELVS